MWPVLGTYLLSHGVRATELDACLDRVFTEMHAARRSWSPSVPLAAWSLAIADRVLRRRVSRTQYRPSPAGVGRREQEGPRLLDLNRTQALGEHR